MAEPAEKKTRRASVNEALQGSKEKLQQEWKARFKAELEAREKAESAWERSYREKRLTDIAREQSRISKARRVREETEQGAIQYMQVQQEWKARFVAEQEAREKAESAWERSIEAKFAWEEARRAHEVARDSLRCAASLTDIARDNMPRDSQVAAENPDEEVVKRRIRSKRPADGTDFPASAGRRANQEIRELEVPPVIPDDDSDSSRVTLSLDMFEDSQTPFEDPQIPE